MAVDGSVGQAGSNGPDKHDSVGRSEYSRRLAQNFDLWTSASKGSHVVVRSDISSDVPHTLSTAIRLLRARGRSFDLMPADMRDKRVLKWSAELNVSPESLLLIWQWWHAAGQYVVASEAPE